MTDKKIYLLLGPENGDKKTFIQELRKKITREKGDPPDEYRFYPYDSDTSDIISMLRNVPLFAPAKMAVIHNCHDLKKKDINLFVDYLKNPSPDTLLVFTTDNIKADPALERAVPADGKKIFWEMYDSTKKGWIIQFFHKNKITIDSSAVDYLCDMIDSNTEALKKECEKIVLFFDQDDTVTEDKISNFFYNSRYENIYSLFEHVAVCSLEKSVETAGNIILSGENNPVQIIGGLLRQFRKLNELKKLTRRKVSFQDACQSLGIRGKKTQAVYSAGQSGYSLGDIEKIIALIAWYDSFFRSVRQEMQHLMVPLFLYSVIKRKGEWLDPSGRLYQPSFLSA